MRVRYAGVKKYAQCPFFISSGKETVLCEGITDDCSVTLRFTSPDKRTIYRRRYCNAHYEECSLYKLLEDKYEKTK